MQYRKIFVAKFIKFDFGNVLGDGFLHFTKTKSENLMENSTPEKFAKTMWML